MSKLSNFVQECPISFGEILLEEPRLIDLMGRALNAKRIYDAWGKVPKGVLDRYWYKSLKPEMLELVGFDCKNKRLQSAEVYDLVYRFFIALLNI